MKRGTGGRRSTSPTRQACQPCSLARQALLAMDLHKRHYLGSSKLLGLIRRSIDHELPMPSISLAPLSPKQQRQLIRGSDLGPKARSALRYWLRNNPKLAVFAQIPMLLTLFCDCFRATNASQLPAGLYGAIDVAIAGRMGLVGEPIPDQVRKIAEDIASALAAPPTLVLEPTPSTVYGTDPPPDYVSADLFDKAVSLLIRAKIVQFRELTSIEFTHRVFREQFAAKRLIQQQEAFDAVLLFTEPEWSAPIITTLLNGLENVKLKLLNGAAELLARDTVDVAGVVADISLFLVDDAYRLPVRFEWPADALMTLRIKPRAAPGWANLFRLKFAAMPTFSWSVHS